MYEPKAQLSNLNSNKKYKTLDINKISINNKYNSLHKNNTCIPSELCGSFYKKKYTSPPKKISIPPMYDKNKDRVNFYLSNNF